MITKNILYNIARTYLEFYTEGLNPNPLFMCDKETKEQADCVLKIFDLKYNEDTKRVENIQKTFSANLKEARDNCEEIITPYELNSLDRESLEAIFNKNSKCLTGPLLDCIGYIISFEGSKNKKYRLHFMGNSNWDIWKEEDYLNTLFSNPYNSNEETNESWLEGRYPDMIDFNNYKGTDWMKGTDEFVQNVLKQEQEILNADQYYFSPTK